MAVMMTTGGMPCSALLTENVRSSASGMSSMAWSDPRSMVTLHVVASRSWSGRSRNDATRPSKATNPSSALTATGTTSRTPAWPTATVASRLNAPDSKITPSVGNRSTLRVTAPVDGAMMAMTRCSPRETATSLSTFGAAPSTEVRTSPTAMRSRSCDGIPCTSKINRSPATGFRIDSDKTSRQEVVERTGFPCLLASAQRRLLPYQGSRP